MNANSFLIWWFDRCLYREPVSSEQTFETTLLTLYAAHKYQCPDLVNFCVSHLTDNLKESNVLTILKDARVYVGDYADGLQIKVF